MSWGMDMIKESEKWPYQRLWMPVATAGYHADEAGSLRFWPW